MNNACLFGGRGAGCKEEVYVQVPGLGLSRDRGRGRGQVSIRVGVISFTNSSATGSDSPSSIYCNPQPASSSSHLLDLLSAPRRGCRAMTGTYTLHNPRSDQGRVKSDARFECLEGACGGGEWEACGGFVVPTVDLFMSQSYSIH